MSDALAGYRNIDDYPAGRGEHVLTLLRDALKAAQDVASRLHPLPLTARSSDAVGDIIADLDDLMGRLGVAIMRDEGEV